MEKLEKLSGDVNLDRLDSHISMVLSLNATQVEALKEDGKSIDEPRVHRMVLAMTDARMRLGLGREHMNTLVLGMYYYMLNERNVNYQIVA